MKATVTIEIEGSKEEIDSITHRLSKFVKKDSHRIKMNPIENMCPSGFRPKNDVWHSRKWW